MRRPPPVLRDAGDFLVVRMIGTRRALMLMGSGLFGLTLAALALHLPGADTVGTAVRKDVFVALLTVSAIVYLFAIRLVVSRATDAGAVLIVLVVAVAMRLPVVLAPPFLSSDVYRYVWDGRVQLSGINPYRFVPADPALQALRDDAIFPHINRADTARTIYPPMAQVVFQAVARVSNSVTAVKLAMVGFEALACWAVLRLLARARLPGERLLIYAWNPLAIWAFAGNGHVDAAAIGLLAVALLLRVHRRDAWVGIALAAAVLVKFLPVAVAPALWRRGAAWRMPLVALALSAGLYLCYSGVGWHVLGFLPGYFGDEDLGRGTGIWLLAGIGLLIPVTPMMADAYFAAVVAGFAALAACIAFRPHGVTDDVRRICGDAAILAAAVTVAISPHYPWYFVWLALPCCVCARWSVIWLAVAPVLLYLDPFRERFFWPSLVYLPAAALAVHEWWHAAETQPLDGVNATQGSS
jgi:alpha-1,6-mannosyltransferase